VLCAVISATKRPTPLVSHTLRLIGELARGLPS
jgi:hypothetical protein